MKRQMLVVFYCLVMGGVAVADTSTPAPVPDEIDVGDVAQAMAPLDEAMAPLDEGERFEVRLRADYLWDGGAVPFVYGSGALALGLRLFLSPSSRPRLFPFSEGGASVSGDTVPELALGLGAVAGVGLVALLPSAGRWHHLKGYGQALLTTIALTEITKNLIGRHRPTYQPGDTDKDLRRSFFSGHSSVTAVSTMYLGLYLTKYILPQVQGPYAPTLRVLTWGALGAAFVGVPYSRLHDKRHHLSDVTTGAVVGSVFALSFYAYQESRLLRSEEEFYARKRQSMMVVPDLKNRGLSLVSVW